MDGLTDVRLMDGWTDRHTDIQRETIIPCHCCVVGYKKTFSLICLFDFHESYVAEMGFELATPGSAKRYTINCVLEPS